MQNNYSHCLRIVFDSTLGIIHIHQHIRNTLPARRLRKQGKQKSIHKKKNVTHGETEIFSYYGVATISRLLKIMGLFRKRAL